MKLKVLLPFLLTFFSIFSQERQFTKQDTLRGSITKERAWWDLLHYELSVKVDPTEKMIEGNNTIRYKVLENNNRMQIDLQPPMEIISAKQNGQNLTFIKDGNVYYITVINNQLKDSIYTLTLDFKGKPKISKRPPWDDGFTWSKDSKGNDFIATSCQGGGASIWWPNKDHMYDEPDNGITMHITTPEHLMGVGNGRLINTIQNNDSTKTFTWNVVNPINNYGVNVNIGDYVHFGEKFQGEKGELDCDYYVLTENLEEAKEQFKQASKMLEAFEHWFGPYPFYEDSFKLVEVPYLGMEHQSSVTYGNNYENGYLGYDLSGTGWGLKFDFIIIHEAGHEWFANNITYKDIADMWIHEGFTAYSENLYLDYHFGKEASNAYVTGTRKNIQNDRPVIGKYDVNYEGSGDMYYKGANMLHTLRQIVNNDEKWRTILRGLNSTFYHQTITTKQIEDYLSEHIEINLKPFFDQYLRTTDIPVLEYKIDGNKLVYKWSNTVKDFTIPVKVYINEKESWLNPTTEWQKTNITKRSSFLVDNNFYVTAKNIAK